MQHRVEVAVVDVDVDEKLMYGLYYFIYIMYFLFLFCSVYLFMQCSSSLYIYLSLYYAACAKTPFFFNPIMGATLE